ncbi:hypothetical protein CNY89_29735, partial [Amaricoccus sp. HAR-UPW-R2A-40]
EILSGGDGPHEVLLTPGGTQLAVANGGIATDTASGRAPLNPFEILSGGDGPHEVLLTPGGTQLAVANGGIATDTA